MTAEDIAANLEAYVSSLTPNPEDTFKHQVAEYIGVPLDGIDPRWFSQVHGAIEDGITPEEFAEMMLAVASALED